MTEHTPGPWTARKDDYSKHMINITGPNGAGDSVCRVKGYAAYREEAKANAFLMAAAPDLLEALVYQTEVLDAHNQCKPHSLGMANAVEKARAAIAKAKGETQ